MDGLIVVGIVISLCGTFFFSGIELAFLSSNKLLLELKAKQGSTSGKIMSYFLNKPAWFIGTTLTGNTLTLVIFGYFMMLWLAQLQDTLPAFLNHGFYLIAIQTILCAIVILFTAEFLPKNLFTINPNAILSILAIPFAITFGLLFPLMLLVVQVSKVIVVYILRLDYSEEKPVFGLTDLNIYLQSMRTLKHENENIELDTTIFHNALEFKTVRVRNCMIPRTEIIALPVTAGIEKLREIFVESGHSKIVIFKETTDNIIGYCHSSALFKKPERIEDIITPIITVSETTLANDLMITFINERKSLAVVINEFGGTSGLVSMEDVIEEIFGEIEDEHDNEELIEQKIDSQTFMLSGRLEISYLNKKYELNLPLGDYETLSGLVLTLTKKAPIPGEIRSLSPFTFTVQTTQNNRIDTLKVQVDKV